MADSVELIEEDVQLDERNSLLEMARKVLLASFGAVVLAQEEVESFVEKLVERGEIAEKDGKKLLRELRERRKTEPAAEVAAIEQERRMDALLKRINIPTRSEIEALSQKITHLTEKVDDLLTATEAQAEKD
ncbi:MAG: phasin family protein [Candidatus Promineifilaceae bacterium]